MAELKVDQTSQHLCHTMINESDTDAINEHEKNYNPTMETTNSRQNQTKNNKFILTPGLPLI